MDKDVKNETKEKLYEDGMIHLILSHSYTVFLFAVVLGVIFDIIFPIEFFEGYLYQYIGFIMIILGSGLIYWAQSTSSSTRREMDKKKTERQFDCGPYKYSRNPTSIGLTIMTLGLAFLINSLFSVIFVIIASFIKIIFIKKEEDILEKKYGQAYCDYKKKVKTWI